MKYWHCIWCCCSCSQSRSLALSIVYHALVFVGALGDGLGFNYFLSLPPAAGFHEKRLSYPMAPIDARKRWVTGAAFCCWCCAITLISRDEFLARDVTVANRWDWFATAVYCDRYRFTFRLNLHRSYRIVTVWWEFILKSGRALAG